MHNTIPKTNTAPVRSRVLAVPARWLELGEDYAELLVESFWVVAVDFYPARIKPRKETR